MDYDVLVNLRFRKNEGSTDLKNTTWNSMVIHKNSRMESIDYSAAGRFTGECAYFDGEISQLKKMNGHEITINGTTDMTISVWFNSDPTESNLNQYFINGNSLKKTNSNSFYMTHDDVHHTLKLVLVDRAHRKIESDDISALYKVNDWNHIAAVRSNGKMGLYLNGQLVSTLNAAPAIYEFTSSVCMVGKGYDEDHLIFGTMKGYLDDLVIMRYALPINADTTIDVPNNYLMNVIDPALAEESPENLWTEDEREYSRYDDIIHTTEWKRFNTKDAIYYRQHGLVPYRLKELYTPIDVNVPDWIRPNIHGAYSILDKVSYNAGDLYVSNKNKNDSTPGTNSDWTQLGMSSDIHPTWVLRKAMYKYMQKCIYKKRVYQSQINYNKDVPCYWVLMDENDIDIPADIPTWTDYDIYRENDIIKYNDKFYQSTIDNNINHTPGDISKWKEVGGSISTLEEWSEPNPFMKGDIIKQDDMLYYSNVDDNIFEPKTHIVQWTPFLEWKMCTYTNTYKKGDKVDYNGQTYVCTRNGSHLAPDEYRSRKFYRSLRNNNKSIPGTSSEWKRVYDIDLTEEQMGKASEHKKGVPYHINELVKVTDGDWYITTSADIYVKDGVFVVNRDYNALGIRLYSAMDNFFLTNDKNRRRFNMKYLTAYNTKWIGGYMLMINGKFIPWEDINVVRSDRYVTLFVSNLPRQTQIDRVDLIHIPFRVSYSNSGFIPENGIKLFGFEKDKSCGNDYVISTTNTNVRCLEYSGTTFDNLYLDTNLTHKITKANIYVFKEDGTLVEQDKYSVSAANIFNMNTDGHTKYRVIVIWYINENPSEDNLSLIPNQEDVRKYVIYPDTDQDKAPISLKYLKTEFNFKHVPHKTFDQNIDSSMNYIFGYNKNKYDEVYEKVRPVNFEEYSEEYMNSLKRTIRIQLTEEYLDILMHSYMMINDYTLVELTEHNKDRFMGKTIMMKLRREIPIHIDASNINKLIGCTIKDDTSKYAVQITPINKDQYIDKDVILKGMSVLKSNTLNTDHIIMSRDIYDKMDYKNNTYVMLFKRGMLPKWYNTIKYTNDQFYFKHVPRSGDKKVTFVHTENQTIFVECNGMVYDSKTNPGGFTTEEGSEINVWVVADPGYFAGEPNMTDGVIYENTSISASDAIPMVRTVTIVASPHQTIIATIVGNDMTPNSVVPGTQYICTNTNVQFEIPYATKIKAEISAEVGYDVGNLNLTEVVVKANTTIRATNAEHHIYQIVLRNLDPMNQDFTAVCNGKTYTTTFTGTYGQTYTLSAVSKKPGYSAGHITDPGNGVITQDTVCTVGKITIKDYMIKILNTDHQKLEVIYNGITYSENQSFKVKYGDAYKVRVTSDIGYNAGKPKASDNGLGNINIQNIDNGAYQILTTNGKVGDNGIITISAEPAVLKRYVVNIIQSPHQTIQVTYNDQNHTSTFNVPYGGRIKAKIINVENGYTAGNVNIADTVVTSNITITATAASVNWYTIHIIQSPNQTVYVESDGTDHTSDYRVRKGTEWFGRVIPHQGYISPGLNGPSNGTISSDITVSAQEAQIAPFTRTFDMFVSNYNTCHGYSSWYADDRLEIGYRMGACKMMDPKGSISPDPIITSNGLVVCLESFFTITYQYYCETNEYNLAIGEPIEKAFYRTYFCISNEQGGRDAYKIKRVKLHLMTPLTSWNHTNFGDIELNKYYVDTRPKVNYPDKQYDYTYHRIDQTYIGGERGGYYGKIFYYDTFINRSRSGYFDWVYDQPNEFNLAGINGLNTDTPVKAQFAIELFDY
jgi:hypothetical protein